MTFYFGPYAQEACRDLPLSRPLGELEVLIGKPASENPNFPPHLVTILDQCKEAVRTYWDQQSPDATVVDYDRRAVLPSVGFEYVKGNPLNPPAQSFLSTPSLKQKEMLITTLMVMIDSFHTAYDLPAWTIPPNSHLPSRLTLPINFLGLPSGVFYGNTPMDWSTLSFMLEDIIRNWALTIDVALAALQPNSPPDNIAWLAMATTGTRDAQLPTSALPYQSQLTNLRQSFERSADVIHFLSQCVDPTCLTPYNHDQTMEALIELAVVFGASPITMLMVDRRKLYSAGKDMGADRTLQALLTSCQPLRIQRAANPALLQTERTFIRVLGEWMHFSRTIHGGDTREQKQLKIVELFSDLRVQWEQTKESLV